MVDLFIMSMTLTPTSYLVLGAIAEGGPATPYELKQAVEVGVGYFWTFPHSQLYSEPERLARAGLLSERREQAGRRRRVFSITASGRAALAEWLADPTPELPEIRDVGLLKLFFSDLGTSEQAARLARSQQQAHRERHQLYKTIERAGVAGGAGATVQLGLAYEKAAIAFWAAIATNPPAAPAKP